MTAWRVALVAVPMLGVIACSSTSTPATNTTTTSPPTTTASNTTTTAAGTSSSTTTSSAGGDYQAEARSNATQACRVWANGVMQDAVDRSVAVKQAASLATKASSLDVHWAAEAKAMTFVSSLPETGNSPADIAQSTADQREIAGTCAGLGVTIPN